MRQENYFYFGYWTRITALLAAFATSCLASAAIISGPGGVGVTAGSSDLIGTYDFTETWTIGPTAIVPDRVSYTAQTFPLSDAVRVVENTHGNPSASWSSTLGSIATDTLTGKSPTGASPWPGGTGAGTATGFSQTGAATEGNFTIAYGLRDSFIVQADMLLGTGRSNIFLNDAPFAGGVADVTAITNNVGLAVFFRDDANGLFGIGVYNGITEIDTGLTTGLSAGEQERWHNFAVEFDLVDGDLSFWVDEAFRGTFDYQSAFPLLNVSNAFIGIGSAGAQNRLWTDNFQVGAAAVTPVPEPATWLLFGVALIGVCGVRKARRPASTVAPTGTLLICLMIGVLAGNPIEAAEKPNVVIFFTDDTGYRDIGPFGGLTPTPHLDRLAAEGMKLTSFYVSSVKCTPSRAALLTGCYASRIGMGGAVVYPGQSRGLNPDEITIAEMLKPLGYRTGCIGKWHLGDQPELLPLTQGFDEFEGIPYSCDMWNYLNPRARHKLKQKGLENPRSPLPWLKGSDVVAWIDAPLSHALMNDAITKSCVDFIDRNKDQPFFLYVPFPATHRPQIVLEERAKRIQALGCIDVPKYTQIAEVDTCVGAVVDALRKHDLDRKTMVLYSNDNGGVSGFYEEGLTVPRGGKFGPKYEGTMRMATLAWWPGKIPAGVECDELVSSIDVFPTIASLAGGEVPADRVIDGKDVSKVLLQKGASPNKQVFYMGTGVREGRWKLLKMSKTKSALFDLQEDFGETTDVSADHPEMVERLEKTLRAHQIALSKDRRPAGKASTAKPLLSDPTGLPTLAERLGRRGEKVYGVK